LRFYHKTKLNIVNVAFFDKFEHGNISVDQPPLLMTLFSKISFISVEAKILIRDYCQSSTLRMKPTCLFLSIFLFHTEYFFNPDVFTLLFNKSHLYNCVTYGSQLLHQVFRHAVMIKMRIIKRKKDKSKLNLRVRLNQLHSSVVSTLVRVIQSGSMILNK